MRTRSIATVAAVAMGALATGVAPAGAATTKTKQPQVNCTIYLTEVSGGELKGKDKGPLSCSALGDGSQTDSFNMKFNKGSKTAGTGLVKFTEKFAHGSVSGTWKLKFKISGPAVSINFAVKYTGGTGAYKGIAGSGRGTGALTSLTTGTFTYTANLTSL